VAWSQLVLFVLKPDLKAYYRDYKFTIMAEIIIAFLTMTMVMIKPTEWKR